MTPPDAPRADATESVGLPSTGSCATCGREIDYGQSYTTTGDLKRRHSECTTEEDWRRPFSDPLFALAAEVIAAARAVLAADRFGSMIKYHRTLARLHEAVDAYEAAIGGTRE